MKSQKGTKTQRDKGMPIPSVKALFIIGAIACVGTTAYLCSNYSSPSEAPWWMPLTVVAMVFGFAICIAAATMFGARCDLPPMPLDTIPMPPVKPPRSKSESDSAKADSIIIIISK